MNMVLILVALLLFLVGSGVLVLRPAPVSKRWPVWILVVAAAAVVVLRMFSHLHSFAERYGIAPHALLQLSWWGGVCLALVGALFLLLLLLSTGRAEGALRASEARYRELFESSRDAVYISTRDGMIVDANPAFLELFGLTRDDLGNVNARGFYVDPSDRERFRREIQERGQVSGYELRLRRKDGTERVCHLSATVRRGEDGEVLGYQGIIRDVTEQRRAEDALRESEGRFRAMSESAASGVVLSDGDGRIVFWNDAAGEIFGYTSEEVLGRPLEILVPERSREAHRQGFESMRASDDVRLVRGTAERRGLRKDGSEFPLEISMSGWSSGERRFYGAILRDLTAEKRLEEQLRRAQRMEVVGQVTAGVAHDFNNLLTVIQNNAALIAEAWNPSEPEQRELLRDLQASARSGAMLVRKLMAFSRQEALSLQPVGLRDLLREMTPMLRRVLPENIEVQLAVEDPVPTVLADPGSVEQILINLATNARDAMPSGGVLRIAGWRTQVQEEDVELYGWARAGDYVVLCVSDTGMGMDEETQARLFEPFFTTKPPGEGTGLGMAVVYGLMRNHGGFIHVYSAEGEGTTVKLYFPVAAGEKARTRTIPETPGEMPTGSETILVLEDNPELQRVAKRALERLGYTVLVASDGEEGLEVFRARGEEIDLILADRIMPRLGGMEVHEALQKEGGRVRFLLMSGYVSDEAQGRPGGALGVPFLQKPWTIAELARKVREVLDA